VPRPDWRRNHLTVSSGVESSPMSSHENGKTKICAYPARMEQTMNTRWCATMSILPSFGYLASTCARSSIMYPKNTQFVRSMTSTILSVSGGVASLMKNLSCSGLAHRPVMTQMPSPPTTKA